MTQTIRFHVKANHDSSGSPFRRPLEVLVDSNGYLRITRPPPDPWFALPNWIGVMNKTEIDFLVEALKNARAYAQESR